MWVFYAIMYCTVAILLRSFWIKYVCAGLIWQDLRLDVIFPELPFCGTKLMYHSQYQTSRRFYEWKYLIHLLPKIV